MTKRFFGFRIFGFLGLVASLVAMDAALPASQASAQEVQITGPLAGAPAVRRMRLYREGRFLIEPNFSFTLQDEFARSLIAGAHLGYYFTDWLGVGIWGGYTVASLDTGLTDEIRRGGVTTDRNALSLPSRQGFSDQIANMTYVAALQLEFIPLRGKLAMFQKLFVDTDFHIFLGVAMVGVEERADVGLNGRGSNADTLCNIRDGGNISQCLLDSQSARSSRLAIAPTFGAGLTMMFNDFVGLNFDWRGMPFSWNTSGTDESGDDDGDFPDGEIDEDDRFFKFNQMVQIGIVIYLPTAPTITE
jgi:outer membrane beta-barrel protein